MEGQRWWESEVVDGFATLKTPTGAVLCFTPEELEILLRDLERAQTEALIQRDRAESESDDKIALSRAMGALVDVGLTQTDDVEAGIRELGEMAKQSEATPIRRRYGPDERWAYTIEMAQDERVTIEASGGNGNGREYRITLDAHTHSVAFDVMGDLEMLNLSTALSLLVGVWDLDQLWGNPSQPMEGPDDTRRRAVRVRAEAAKWAKWAKRRVTR